MSQTAATLAVKAAGLDHEVVEYPPADSAEDAADRRGVALHQLIKTLVVRRGEGDLLLVLVPGDRVIDWPALRHHLGVSRISMAGRAEATEATGYAPGTITPFGAATELPMVADAAVEQLETASIGGGAQGIAINIRGRDLITHFGADVGTITKPNSTSRH